MNCLLLKPEDFTSSTSAYIADYRFEHCKRILKAKQGDIIQIGELDGELGSALIDTIEDDHLTLKRITFDQSPPKPLDLTVIIALARPKALKRILRNIAEFGIKEVILLNTYKVEKSYWQTPVITEAEKYFIQGLEQAKDTVLPSLYIEKRFKPFVEDKLPELCQTHNAFVAHPAQKSESNQPFISLLALQESAQKSRKKTLAVIGPEGGFIPYEVDKLLEAGCQPLDLGKRIYRVENALSLICLSQNTI